MQKIKRFNLWFGGMLIVCCISGCTLYPVSDSKAVNEGLTYLPWHEAKKELKLEPGMVLKLTQTTLSEKGRNLRTPVITDFEWQRSLDGQYTRRDLLFLRHLLIGSRPDCGSDKNCGDQQLTKKINELNNPDIRRLSSQILAPALDTLAIVYPHIESTISTDTMRELICGVKYAIPNEARKITFSFSDQDYWVFQGDISKVYFDGNLDQRGDQGQGLPGGWFKNDSKVFSGRMDPSVSIPIMIEGVLDPLFVAPCRTVLELEEQLGQKDIVVRLKRQEKYWPVSIDGVEKVDVKGDDGFVSIIFHKTGHIGKPGLVYIKPELKKDLLLAPGDIVELESGFPNRLHIVH